MGYDALKESVLKVNVGLVGAGLIALTWGNASGADRSADGGKGVMGIKPSGVPYEKLTANDIVIVSLATGKVIEGSGKPSSDTATHLELYRAFEGVGGVVHTHSFYATCFAQAKREIPCLGTTHADHFCGTIPVTRELTAEEIKTEYELNTGKVIVECFREKGIKALEVPGVLVASHGPFAWGATAEKALENAFVLEQVARMLVTTYQLKGEAGAIPEVLLHKHFFRKHGPGATYGQGK